MLLLITRMECSYHKIKRRNLRRFLKRWKVSELVMELGSWQGPWSPQQSPSTVRNGQNSQICMSICRARDICQRHHPSATSLKVRGQHCRGSGGSSGTMSTVLEKPFYCLHVQRHRGRAHAWSWHNPCCWHQSRSHSSKALNHEHDLTKH